MSVEQTDKIDVIGIEKRTDDVVLTISDHLSWSDERHVQLLQDKINTYIGVIESGELLEVYADAEGRDSAIRVVFQCDPSPEGLRFLEQVEAALTPAGIGFQWKVLSDD